MFNLFTMLILQDFCQLKHWQLVPGKPRTYAFWGPRDHNPEVGPMHCSLGHHIWAKIAENMIICLEAISKIIM